MGLLDHRAFTGLEDKVPLVPLFFSHFVGKYFFILSVDLVYHFHFRL